MRRQSSGGLVIGVVLSVVTFACGEPPTAPTPAPQQSTLAFSSKPNDSVGVGQNYEFTAASARFETTLDYPGSIVVTVLSNDRQSYWRVHMGAPAGQELQVGTYDGAIAWSAAPASQPRFTVSGDGRACGRSEGYFAIRELVRGPAILLSTGVMVPSITRLHVQFTQRCAPSSAPGLTGELWLIQ